MRFAGASSRPIRTLPGEAPTRDRCGAGPCRDRHLYGTASRTLSRGQEGGKLVERLEEYRRAEGRYPEDLAQLDVEMRFVPASDSRGIEYRPREDGSEFLLTCFAFGRSGFREAYSSRTGSWRSFD